MRLSAGEDRGRADSFARAYAAMLTEPEGPIYMCYDAWLQEQPLSRDIPCRSRRITKCRHR